jgi:hypothetical protein
MVYNANHKRGVNGRIRQNHELRHPNTTLDNRAELRLSSPSPGRVRRRNEGETGGERERHALRDVNG